MKRIKFEMLGNPVVPMEVTESSMTQADCAIPIREILDKYANGIVATGINNNFDDTADDEDAAVHPLMDDIDDPLTYKQELQAKLRAVNEIIKKHKAKEAAEKAERSEAKAAADSAECVSSPKQD